jgi:hypothetical protein
MFRHWLPPIFRRDELTTVKARKAKAMSEVNCLRVCKEWIAATRAAAKEAIRKKLEVPTYEGG